MTDKSTPDAADSATLQEKEALIQQIQALSGATREQAESQLREAEAKFASMTPEERAAAQEQAQLMQRQMILQARIGDPGQYLGKSLVADISLLEEAFNANAAARDGQQLTAREQALTSIDSRALEKMIELKTGALEAVTNYKRELLEERRAGASATAPQPSAAKPPAPARGVNNGYL